MGEFQKNPAGVAGLDPAIQRTLTFTHTYLVRLLGETQVEMGTKKKGKLFPTTGNFLLHTVQIPDVSTIFEIDLLALTKAAYDDPTAGLIVGKIQKPLILQIEGGLVFHERSALGTAQSLESLLDMGLRKGYFGEIGSAIFHRAGMFR